MPRHGTKLRFRSLLEDVVTAGLNMQDDQAYRAELGDISDKLRCLAQEMKSFSEVQSNYPERMRFVQNELKSIVGRLRGIN